MTPVLFYDTETSGLPDFKAPSESPTQPHIVQVAGLLVDLETRRELASMDVIVRPNGWVIPPDVTEIHGITNEMAMDLGVGEGLALEMLMSLWSQRTRIGHNQSFDARIVRIAQHRFPEHYAQEDLDDWKNGAAECTQLICTPILQLPPTEKMKAARRFHHKSCNLAEAYEFFFKKPLVDAHSALADCRAARDVYFAALDWHANQARAA